MKNKAIEAIVNELKQANTILLFPHVNMDGDTLGSAVALCKALRKMNKECHVLIEDEIPSNLQFLDKGYCTNNMEILPAQDLSICIDCGDANRFALRKDKFNQGKKSICIDHHLTTTKYCDVNLVDSTAAAAAQLIYELLLALGAEIDQEIGEAIFAAITTDTGNFQYSNTTKKTHEIVGALYDVGIDSNKVSICLYENIRLERLMIQNKALSTLTTLCNGEVAMAYVTQDMLAQVGASMDETEGVVEALRSIKGVKIAAFLKETEPEIIKISLRAKGEVSISGVAEKIGGGGHAQAAGCTINKSLTEAFDEVKAELLAYMER
ncbi:phosphoesterase RecJ-like protein [Clostridiales Family XIII bacterium PM5-7]